MSEGIGATFSQPATATAGLANYDLEPHAKELYPSPEVDRSRTRKRSAAWRKRFLSRGMKKGQLTMTTLSIEAMVDTLSKSVASILAANPVDRDELLTKSFGEFKDFAIVEFNGALAKSAPEEPLYKGLGTVGRVANLVGSIASQIQTIQRGYENWQTNKDGDPPDDADPASPELDDHLMNLLTHAEMIMRASVNEHCEPMDDDDDGDGMHVVMVPMDGGGEMAVKTDLPGDLAKFATDPATLEGMALEQGFATLARVGVDVEQLSKAIEAGELAKDAGMPGAAPSPMMGSADAASMAGAGLPDDGQPENPLDVLSRLAALMMVQIDYLQQQIDGTNEPDSPDGEDPAAVGAGATPPSVDDAEAQKAAATGELAKLGDLATDETLAKVLKAHNIDLGALAKIAEENAALRTEMAEINVQTKDLLKRAQPPKAPLITSHLISKEGDDVMSGGQRVEQDLSKLSPMERSMELMKRQQQHGRPTNGAI